MKSQKAMVFSIQVSNISCVNCATALTTLLTKNIEDDPSLKVSVNIMNEKVTLTTLKQQTSEQAMQILQESKFKPLGQPILISGNDSNQRDIDFFVPNHDRSKELSQHLQITHGILHMSSYEEPTQIRYTILYDSVTLSGRDIADIIATYSKTFQVKNQRVQGLKTVKRLANKEEGIALTIMLGVYFMIGNMIFPILPSLKEFYNECVTFPQKFGIYTFSVLLNIFITIYVMVKYAKALIWRAFMNFKSFRVTNMETLIALGSVSALFLFVYFIFKHSIDFFSGNLVHRHQAIMDINSSLSSASIIVLVVTIGKYFQGKVKQKITKMNDELFPESVLFQNMNSLYVQLKNRKLNVLDERVYDVSLIEKNDIVRIMPGMLLLDVIVIEGSARVTQSARTGSDDILTVGKGERIQSGSIIHTAQNCLGLVEKVIEKSLLIEIVTHVKFSQNQQENGASSIEILCKTIADYFVKTVIVLSLITMTAWTVILSFDLTQVPVSSFSWVIERGIGVLVASCPCAVGLAIPSVIANILNLAIKSGILIKKTNIFEKIKSSKIVAFDKTGTLFTKINRIEQRFIINKTLQEEQIWQILAILERDIKHPLAQIIYKEAFNLSHISGTNFSFIVIEQEYIPGQGIKATLLNKSNQLKIEVLVGNRKLLTQNGVETKDIKSSRESYTTIFMALNGETQMVMYLNTHSNLRPEAVAVIRKLEQQGLSIHILSGDSQGSVDRLGRNLKLSSENLHSEYSPTEKLQWVENIQKKQNQLVIMVGDGLNDIPCLQEAGIGISINAKSELNINAADVVILSENLYKILALVRFLKRGNLFIRLNLFWAFAYNVIIMPITAGMLFPLDIFVSPVWSSIAMSCSSLLVVGFSHLLSCFSYDDSLSEARQTFPKAESTLDLVSSNREVFSVKDELS